MPHRAFWSAVGFVSANLTWALCSLANAQPTADKEIDRALMSQTVIRLDCNLQQYHAANDCLRRVVPTLAHRVAHYAAMQSTFLLKVEYAATDTVAASSSVGTAFLVDRERGYFLTAKHVLMGQRVWSTVLPNRDAFADLETAIEDHLSTSGKVTISLQSSEDQPRVSASLIAMDRNTDLALVAVGDPNAFPVTNFAALYRPLPMAAPRDCNGKFNVSAIGFAESTRPGRMEQKPTDMGSAECQLSTRTYSIGGQKYRVPLLNTQINFLPGFSGGPVLDEEFRVVGVVSGATVAGGGTAGYRYFVPVSAAQSFLSRFR